MPTERAKRAANKIAARAQWPAWCDHVAQIIAEEYADLEAEVEAFHRPIWKGVALPVRGPTPSEMLKRIAELEAENARLVAAAEDVSKLVELLHKRIAELKAEVALLDRTVESRDIVLARLRDAAEVLDD